MVREKADSETLTSHRKAADYLLRALQEADSSDTHAVRKLVYLAKSELDENLGKGARQVDCLSALTRQERKKL
ncbi:hypothetical protein SAMN04515647_1984 [Cohaesibacter sp. ES.047]|nr:hypothetical protein SAMN04515647_1984 [Cohaesibacter sp. ES.047]